MNILSWNVNGLRALCKKGQFDWLLRHSPDIFCLQETKAEKHQLPAETAEPKGYYSYYDHSKAKKGYSGVAIYSKIKPNKVEYKMGNPTLDNEGRLISAHYDDFVLVNVYFPNGGGGPDRLEFKLAFYDEFLSYVDDLRKKGCKIIFCGDINTAHEEIDLARPKENENNTGFLPVERAWLDEVVAHGYADVFRYFYPNKTGIYTYWDMKTFSRSRNVGWRIDYFFVTPEILNNVKAINTFTDIHGSDHCPLEIKVDLLSSPAQ